MDRSRLLCIDPPAASRGGPPAERVDEDEDPDLAFIDEKRRQDLLPDECERQDRALTDADFADPPVPGPEHEPETPPPGAPDERGRELPADDRDQAERRRPGALAMPRRRV